MLNWHTPALTKLCISNEISTNTYGKTETKLLLRRLHKRILKPETKIESHFHGVQRWYKCDFDGWVRKTQTFQPENHAFSENLSLTKKINSLTYSTSILSYNKHSSCCHSPPSIITVHQNPLIINMKEIHNAISINKTSHAVAMLRKPYIEEVSFLKSKQKAEMFKDETDCKRLCGENWKLTKVAYEKVEEAPTEHTFDKIVHNI